MLRAAGHVAAAFVVVALALGGGVARARAAPAATCAPGERCPDLVIRRVSVAISSDGRSVELSALVVNVGPLPSGATTLGVSEPGSTAWPVTDPVAVDPLPVKGTETVALTVPIPDAARGGSQEFVLTVDPADTVDESDEENNSGKTEPLALPAGNLTVALAEPATADDGATFVFPLTVTNDGKAPTAQTTVDVAAPGWSSRNAEVPSLDAQGSTTLEVSVPIDAAARGTDVTFTATVDPEPHVAETSYEDNTSSTVVSVTPLPPPTTTTPPPPPPPTRANLTVRIVSKTLRGDPRLTLLVEVANRGDTESRATTVVVAARGAPSVTRSVAPLAGHATRRQSVGLRVPDGRALRFVATVDPARSIPESSYADNASAVFTVVVPGQPPPPPPPPPHRSLRWLEIAAGVLVVLLAAGATFLGRRLRTRMRWQRAARDEEPPETCEVPESYVWRRELRPKPALRRIEAVVLSGPTGDGEEREREAGEELVSQLNRAVRAHRRRGDAERMHELLGPAAEGLASGAREWLERGGDAVAVRARLVGGKLECEFRRYECVRTGPTCAWRERQRWTAELEDAAEEPVGELSATATSGPARADVLARLERQLRAFVDRVDFRGRAEPQRTAPARD